MKLHLFIILFLSSTTKAQDTIRISCSQEQAIKALLEKGFAIDYRKADTIITKPFETKQFGVAGHNELLIRMTIINQGVENKITGQYVARNTYYHTGGKGWVQIYDNKKTAKTWGIMNNFAKYLTDEVSKK